MRPSNRGRVFGYFGLAVLHWPGRFGGRRSSLIVVGVVRKDGPIVIAAVEGEIGADKPAVSSSTAATASAVRPARMDCGDVGVIKAETRNILGKDGAGVANVACRGRRPGYGAKGDRAGTSADVAHDRIATAGITVARAGR